MHGVLGGVGSMAAQLAAWRGATVSERCAATRTWLASTTPSIIVLRSTTATLCAAIRQHAPDGVHRIVEVSFSDNADLDAAVAAPDAVIAAYATRDPRPTLDFWPMLFANLTIRLLGSDDFPVTAKHQAAADLSAAAHDGALRIPVGDPLPLARIADAHDQVDAGPRERIVVTIPPLTPHAGRDTDCSYRLEGAATHDALALLLLLSRGYARSPSPDARHAPTRRLRFKWRQAA